MTDLLPADWADLLDRSAASVAGLVASAPEGTDWTTRAPGLDWSLHQVVEHMADEVVACAVLAHLFAEPDPGADAWAALLDRCGRTGGDADWRWHNTGT